MLARTALALACGAGGLAGHAARAAGLPAGQAATARAAFGAPYALRGGPDRRVIVCNDFSGDPDGVFALAHQLLEPATEVVGVVGTLLPMSLLPNPSRHSAADATAVARELLTVMGLQERIKLHQGANQRLSQAGVPQPSDGAHAIVAEAMRDDPRPLYVTVGASLTDVASAFLLEPRIAQRLTLVWIGGAAYPAGGPEYNLQGDVLAAQVLFNQSTMPIWQVSEALYKQCQFALSEFQTEVKPRGAIGAWLWDRFMQKLATLPAGFVRKATWAMGDSPMVLLASLNIDSCGFETRRVRINDDQTYAAQDGGREVRVCTCIDSRLMFSDFQALLKLHWGQ
jgi:hypothetical protein